MTHLVRDQPFLLCVDVAHTDAKMSPDRQALAKHLADAGVRFVQTNRWPTSGGAPDLIWACDPVRSDLVSDTVRIVGQRTLNRKTRLDVVKAAGARVVPYVAPANTAEFVQALRDWRVDQAIVKFDWSYQRAGVFLWPAKPTQTPKLPADYDPSCDVVMRRHVGASETLKVDAFAGHILGASVLKTQAIGTPNWRELANAGQDLTSLEPETESMLSLASRALSAFGVGYASFDLMTGPDGPAIIEVNTSGVGTHMWQLAPEPYATKLAAALVEALRAAEQFPLFGQLRDRALQNQNDQEAPDLGPLAQDSGSVDDDPARLEAVIDDMTKSVEALSEAERSSIADEAYHALVAHSTETIPFYHAKQNSTSVQPLSRRSVQENAPDLVARTLPKEFGRIEPAYCGGLTTPPLVLSRTRFAHLIDEAIQRRALRWAGLEDAGPIQRLLGGATSRQFGLGADMAPEQLAKELRARGSQTLWSRPSVLVRLALAIGKDQARDLPITGLLSSHEPLGIAQKAFLEDQFGTRVAETYHLGSAGPIGIRCTDSRAFHLMSDAARIEILTSDGEQAAAGSPGALVVTSLYDRAMPLLRFDTGDQASFMSMPDGCSCGSTFPRAMLFGRTANSLMQRQLLEVHDALAPDHLSRFSENGMWQLSAERPNRFVMRIDRKQPLAAQDQKALQAYLSTLTGPDVSWAIENAPLWKMARHQTHRSICS